MHFPVFAKTFCKQSMKLKFYVPISKSLGPEDVRDGLLYLKMWKKSKSLHPSGQWENGKVYSVEESFSPLG